MTRFQICSVTLGVMLSACAVESSDPPPTAAVEQAGVTLQGVTLQGVTLQGVTLQGMSLQGILATGATLAGCPLDNVRVERGEVVAERGGVTLRGAALVGAQFQALVRNLNASPPATAVVRYRVAAVRPELAQYDRAGTGNTFLYTLEQWVDDSASWQLACPADTDGRSVAIPVAAIWDERGDRKESSSMFTFGCTAGVIAKCYRWGYRPWLTGSGDMVAMHWTCTRLARADYCGNGIPHTRNGTKIDMWDTLPEQIQEHGGLVETLGMFFEAGWDTSGAVCLSRARWLLDQGGLLASACPDRLVSPTLPLLGATVCDTVLEVLTFNPGARMYNESYLNPISF
jgi:hypothetical protein